MEDVVFISSDEEMEVGEDNIIFISSDDDDDEISHCSYRDDLSSKVNVKLEISSDSDDDDDLPDIDVNVISIWEASRKEYHESVDSKLIDCCNNQPSEPKGRLLKRPFPPEERFEKWNDISQDEIPAAKLSKFENPLKDGLTSNRFVEAVERDITNSLLVCSLEGIRNQCSLDFNACCRIHSEQVTATSTPVYIETVLSTMMDDYYLQSYGCKALYTALSSQNYLSLFLVNKLLKYLFGSEEQMEAPGLEEFHFGYSILIRQLNLHPPCKPGLRRYYLEICRKWWSHLMDEITNVLHDNTSNRELDFMKEENTTTSHEGVIDFSDVLMEKKLQRMKLFKSITKEEKLARLSTLLKFFTEVVRNHALVWMVKHFSDKVAIFRSGISPIISELMWGGSQVNFGCVNKNVKNLFTLFIQTQTSKKNGLHEYLGEIIAVIAAIIHRYERCSYPEMGNLSRDYARQLFLNLRSSSDLLQNLSNLKPDWLTFHVSAFLLDVEEPANFYKVKERIAQILIAKDKGCSESGFDKEAVCILAIRSMMGMMTLKSSVYLNCPSALQLVSENEDCFWFKQMLDRNFILEQINLIRKTLSLPCIKGRAKFYFDGYESNFTKD